MMWAPAYASFLQLKKDTFLHITLTPMEMLISIRTLLVAEPWIELGHLSYNCEHGNLCHCIAVTEIGPQFRVKEGKILGFCHSPQNTMCPLGPLCWTQGKFFAVGRLPIRGTLTSWPRGTGGGSALCVDVWSFVWAVVDCGSWALY